MAMRLAFMGSPDFAVPALHALLDAGHAIAAVYCQPPRPAGRGQSVRRCPVHAAADALGLEVRTPERLRGRDDVLAGFAALDLDAAVVVAYGLILPPAMLDAPRLGCLNIHASLLPRWRGAAPIQAAILAGDAETGVTIMRMDPGLDTGPMLLRQSVPITPRTTCAMLHDRLAEMGAGLVVRALAEQPPAVAQPAEGASYAPKLSRDDARIDWSQDATAIERRVRAFDPWPGTATTLNGATLKVLAVELAEVPGLASTPAPPRRGLPRVAAESVPKGTEPPGTEPAGPEAGASVPGTALDDALTIACGTGAVRLTRVQAAGRSALDAAAFLRGHPVPAGTVLGG